jgi:molybdenum cofactor cytidylyltransferase
MGQPKALLAFRGGTFLSVLAETLSASCSPVYAVFGCDADELMKSAPQSVVPVKNSDYREGMLTSLQAGLRAMKELPERILFTLVDHPAVGPETVLALLHSDAPITIARYGGKRGHPVVIDRSVAREILAEPSTSKLNNIMDRHAIRYVDVDDPGVGDDIDDPAMYRELLAREGARA